MRVDGGKYPIRFQCTINYNSASQASRKKVTNFYLFLTMAYNTSMCRNVKTMPLTRDNTENLLHLLISVKNDVYSY